MSTRFSDHMLTGLFDDRPAATTVPVGGLYAATDERVVYQSDGADWITWMPVSTGLNDTFFEAQGDLVSATDINTPALVPLGLDDQVLMVDTGEATGIKWGTVAGLWDVTIAKATDESVTSSIALQNDNELLFTPVSGGIYLIEIVLVYGNPVGAGTPDLKVALGEDTTARGVFNTVGLSTADAAAASQILANRTATATFGTAATNRAATLRGTITGNGGSFVVQWAQNTANANPTIVRAGSILRHERIV